MTDSPDEDWTEREREDHYEALRPAEDPHISSSGEPRMTDEELEAIRADLPWMNNQRYLALLAEVDRLRTVARDAGVVAGFIIGYFPGLEDGIRWGSDGPKGNNEDTNEVYLAAKRIVAANEPAETPKAG